MKRRIENISYIIMLMKLYEGKAYGYDLMKTLEKYLGHPVSPSHIYPFLKKMKRKRYIRVEETGPRRKKVYVLTPEGRKFVADIMGRMRNIVDSFLLKDAKVCSHCGAKVLEGGIKMKRGGKTLYFCCVHCRNHYMSQESGL